MSNSKDETSSEALRDAELTNEETPENLGESAEMGTYGAFQTSDDLETRGIVIDYGRAGKFLIARAGGSNQKYKRLAEQLMRPYRRQVETNTMDPEVADAILAELFSRTVLLGWYDVTGRNGQLLKYSPENAKQLLLDLPDLFADLREQAQAAANFRQAGIEDDLGNSKPASDTT